MAYLSESEIALLRFKSVGKNVLISSKSSIYEPENMTIGDNVRIDDFCVLSGHIEIGNFVHIACHVVMTGTKELVSIGNYSTLSYGVKVFSASDDFVGPYYSNPTVEISLRNVIHRMVQISEKCTIGAGSIILPGSVLKQGVSVGALSLVKNTCEAWSVYAGIPAIFIREKEPYL